METLTSNQITSNGSDYYQSSTKFHNNCGMSSMVVCPNCRSSLSPCVAVTCPLKSTPSCTSCQGCQQRAANPCLAGGMVPYFPLPYVCRHWLQVSQSSPCSHNHLCSEVPSSTPTSGGICTQTLNNNKPSFNPFEAWNLPNEYLNSNKTSFLSPSGHLQTNTSQNGFSVSRGPSPEGTLILPNHLPLVSINGFPAYPEKPWTKEDDERVITENREDLQECGWYYGALSWQEAAAILAKTAEGTFLVRDSSSSRCPYALSVQTPQGPTSIRIEYEKGKFWLSCERKGLTPQLGGVIDLVQFYKALALAKDSQKELSEDTLFAMGLEGSHVWVDHRGKIFNPIRVVNPLKKGPPSLQHLCRLATRSLSLAQIDALPPSLKAFLQRYRHNL